LFHNAGGPGITDTQSPLEERSGYMRVFLRQLPSRIQERVRGKACPSDSRWVCGKLINP